MGKKSQPIHAINHQSRESISSQAKGVGAKLLESFSKQLGDPMGNDALQR